MAVSLLGCSCPVCDQVAPFVGITTTEDNSFVTGMRAWYRCPAAHLCSFTVRPYMVPGYADVVRGLPALPASVFALRDECQWCHKAPVSVEMDYMTPEHVSGQLFVCGSCYDHMLSVRKLPNVFAFVARIIDGRVIIEQ
jgi:hypothetical protein